ncbi:MAG: AAA family ATPase [candidate division Zixibacteria bacterium]|nr:AAA family ATPase [candidate division Zixibacteria bacterium]
MNNLGGRIRGSAVITVCSGKGGAGKTTIVRTLVEILKTQYRVAVIDAALGSSGLSSIYGVYPDRRRSLEYFLNGANPPSEFVFPVNGIRFVPSRVNRTLNDIGADRNFNRISEMVGFLKRYNDIVLIDSSSGLDLGLYESLMVTNLALIVVTTDPQSVSDGYAICKLCKSITPQPETHFMLNMINSPEEFEDFNTKIGLLTGKFLKEEKRALGFLRFDKLFMRSPGKVEFSSMLGRDNKVNLSELRKRLMGIIDRRNGGQTPSSENISKVFKWQ